MSDEYKMEISPDDLIKDKGLLDFVLSECKVDATVVVKDKDGNIKRKLTAQREPDNATR
jgi:hypothetical protein